MRNRQKPPDKRRFPSRKPFDPRLIFAGAVVYTLTAHGADTLALRGGTRLVNWASFRWDWQGMDLFKVLVWLVVPLVFALPRLDLGYFTFDRWKKLDWALLATVVFGGALVMVVLPYLPGVGDYYRGWGGYPIERRWAFAERQFLWTLSWITGWEFLHRYWLIKVARDAFPARAPAVVLVTVPLIEAWYHVIQGKPPLECAGMAALSVLLCAWTLRRRNVMLPFLGHLAIELELIAFLFFTE